MASCSYFWLLRLVFGDCCNISLCNCIVGKFIYSLFIKNRLDTQASLVPLTILGSIDFEKT